MTFYIELGVCGAKLQHAANCWVANAGCACERSLNCERLIHSQLRLLAKQPFDMQSVPVLATLHNQLQCINMCFLITAATCAWAFLTLSAA